MTPSFIKVIVNGQPVPDFLLALDCTITHELNQHSTCSVQFREPPAARFFYESSIGKPMELRAVDAAGAELSLFKGDAAGGRRLGADRFRRFNLSGD